jgi:hypothetical protein
MNKAFSFFTLSVTLSFLITPQVSQAATSEKMKCVATSQADKGVELFLEMSNDRPGGRMGVIAGYEIFAMVTEPLSWDSFDVDVVAKDSKGQSTIVRANIGKDRFALVRIMASGELAGPSSTQLIRVACSMIK